MSRRPVIGITANFNHPEARLWLPEAYCRQVEEAGALPVVLPLAGPAVREGLLDLLDGLLLPGGGDLAPLYFGQEPLPGLGEVDPRRDDLELYLAGEAMRRDLPLLGICRGLQVLNVAAGGTLVQDLSGPGRLQHSQKAPRNCPSHTVCVLPGTLLSATLCGPPREHLSSAHEGGPCRPGFSSLSPPEGESVRVRGAKPGHCAEHLAVNSFHHQGVGSIGHGLVISAVAPDGLPEALESPSHRFILGVQWHPETLSHPSARALFAALVKAAREETQNVE